MSRCPGPTVADGTEFADVELADAEHAGAELADAFAIARAVAACVSPPAARADAFGSALLAWSERRPHWDARRAKLTTFVWPWMLGRALDEASSFRHFVRRAPIEESPLSWTTSEIAGPIAVRQAVDHVRFEMDSAEAAVLKEAYYDGRPLREIAGRRRQTEDALQRAHTRLIERLRRHLAADSDGAQRAGDGGAPCPRQPPPSTPQPLAAAPREPQQGD